MKLILIQKVEKLGNAGDLVDVKDGYGRNFLIPKNFAVEPGDSRAKEIIRKSDIAKEKENIEKNKLKDLAESVDGKKFIIKAKADESGKLYGSVGSHDISLSTGIPEKYIKTHYKKTGLNELEIDLADTNANIKIEIIKKA